MALVTEPIALDKSLNTTEQISRNIADVLAEELSAIITAIGGLNFINFEVVQELPTTGISTTTIYLVPSDDPQSENTYDEYINLNGTVSGWEKIGSTDIDLSGYYTSAEVDALLADKADVSDIPTVNDGTLTIQQNGETKGTFTANQSGNSTVNIEIPTTDIQTAVDEFETYNGGILDSLKVALSPIQDLHGYDHPWVGGAGKNKLPLVLADIKGYNTAGTWSGNIYSINGGTIEVLVDDSDNVIGFKVNGIFTNATSFMVYTKAGTPYPFSNTNYIINGCPSGGGASTYKVDGIYRVSGVDTVLTTDYGNGDTADYNRLSSATIVFFRIVIYSGTVDNKIFYPMIRLATESDPTFEPYSNICPISGHTQADVDVSDGDTTQEQVTVNLGGTYYSGTLDVVSGVFIPDMIEKDMGDITYNYNSTENIFGTEIISDMAVPISTKVQLMCSALNALTPKTIEGIKDADDNSIAFNSVNSAKFMRIKCTSYTDGNALKTAMTGQKIVYEIINPTPIQLTPQQVKALVGENHLSAPLDGQEITESKYKQTFTFDDVIAYIQSLS